MKLENITVGYYQDIMILQGVTLAAGEGKINTIIGPNGAGKSTVLTTAFGFLNPLRDKIFLHEKNIAGQRPYTMPSEGMAFIMQDRGIFPDLTVQRNLDLGVWLFKKDRKRVRDVIRWVYEKYPVLGHRRDVHAGSLSGGSRECLRSARP